MDQPTVDDLQAEYNELVRQSKIIKDNNDLTAMQGNNAIADMQAKVDAAQLKLTNIESEFTAAYGKRIKALDDRQAKLIKDEDANNERSRTLSASEHALNNRIYQETASNQSILDANTAILNKNKSVLADIKQSQAVLNDQKAALQKSLDKLANDQADLQKSMANVRADMALSNSIRNEGSQIKADNQKAAEDAQVLLQKANDRKNEVTNLIQTLNAAQAKNNQTLADIKQAQIDLDAKNADLQAKLNEQTSNLITIQHVSEKNQTDLIAIRTQQIDINTKQRDLDEREKNIKLLESQATVSP